VQREPLRQPDLSNDDLRTLLTPYRDQYDVSYDHRLKDLPGMFWFDADDVDRVTYWKFSRMPHRLQRTRNLLRQNSARDFENLTAKAFRCNDELGALRLVTLLAGVGKALGSAILMASEPARYSVIDVNAVRAIQALGYLRDCPTPANRDSSLPSWERYLSAVRDVAARTGWTLREVDRALYKPGRKAS
jgi:hypothetical protein